MKRTRTRFPVKWRLLPAVLLLGLTLLLCWLSQGCPRFSAGAAYRRVLAANLRPEAPLVLRLPVDDQGREWAIGYADGTAYEVCLNRSRLSWGHDAFTTLGTDGSGWFGSVTLLQFSSVEGVCCVPLYWHHLLNPVQYALPGPETPAVAVRAEPEAVRAELSLTVGPYAADPGQPAYDEPAASAALVPLGRQEGWFLFGFDEETLERGLPQSARNEARSLLLWVTRWAAAGANPGANYRGPVQTGSLTLRLYDEADRLLRTVEILP